MEQGVATKGHSPNCNRRQIVSVLPFQNLGFVIVDEEHEPSFKQYSPAPRHHARDAVVVLAQLHVAKVLMGSATPSLETYYNAASNKYGLVQLKERFGKSNDARSGISGHSGKSKNARCLGISARLLEVMREVLSEGEQVILFQNRRGYAPVVNVPPVGFPHSAPIVM